MNTDDEEVNLKAWRQLYEAAVLEVGPTKIQQRIAEAEKVETGTSAKLWPTQCGPSMI